jgi:hypothetical protein
MTIALEERQETSTARDRLLAAIDAVSDAQVACTAAKQIADRGVTDLNRATAALQPFESLDARMAACRVQALKAGEWQGYPTELRSEALRKIHATEEARHAQLASHQLNAELEDARDNLAIAERELDEAAASVFTEQVAEVVAKLDEVNREREYLRRLLRGAGVPFGGPGFERLAPVQRENVMADIVRGAKFPAGTLQDWREVNALATTALMQLRLPDSDEADAVARAYWRRFAEAILCDPDADPGPLPDRDSILV